MPRFVMDDFPSYSKPEQLEAQSHPLTPTARQSIHAEMVE